MDDNTHLPAEAIPLIFRTVALVARWAGLIRKLGCSVLPPMTEGEKDRLIVLQQDTIRQLRSHNRILLAQVKSRGRRPRYTWRDRLYILWHLEYFQIPLRRAGQHFGVARSTIHRWRHQLDDPEPVCSTPANQTPLETAALVWRIFRDNPAWGRCRIANQLRLLEVFLAASTIRRILQRPRPRLGPPASLPGSSTPEMKKTEPRSITARYPNHVWSADQTIVWRWGVWPTYVLAVIDHFSRFVLAVVPLDGPNAGWTIAALENTFRTFGAPKHLITDQGRVFTCAAFTEALAEWKVKPRRGAVGKHGSIAVTEPLIETLKYKWLNRVPLIRGSAHLEQLCSDFITWYNRWRPHMRHDGATPGSVFRSGRVPAGPPHHAKSIPPGIEACSFPDTGITAYRLKDAA